jgi:hypothetical protein
MSPKTMDGDAARRAAEVVSEAHSTFDTIAQEFSTKMVSRWTQAASPDKR